MQNTWLKFIEDWSCTKCMRNGMKWTVYGWYGGLADAFRLNWLFKSFHLHTMDIPFECVQWVNAERKTRKKRTTYDTKYYTIRCSKNGWSVMPHAINKKTKETPQWSSSARCVKYYIHTLRLYGIIFYYCIYAMCNVCTNTTPYMEHDIHKLPDQFLCFAISQKFNGICGFALILLHFSFRSFWFKFFFIFWQCRSIEFRP